MAKKEGYLDFDEYIRQGEPNQREAAYAWSTAIGLQAVDGLKTSEYLNELARKNIEGEITIDEVGRLLDSYYERKTKREADGEDNREADKASKNIKIILSVKTCDFSTQGYVSIHRRIFDGVMKHAGELRKYDITKREWVLEGDTVNYLNWEDLRRALDYDIEQERNFSYRGLSRDEMVEHITKFTSGLWQIHAFGEGNTRTTAVFIIQYLRSIGFDVENDLFAKHSWYFRNALVRANYKNARRGIDYTPIFLERFFRNLLLNEKWDLRNRYLHIHPSEEWSKQPKFGEKPVDDGINDGINDGIKLTENEKKLLSYIPNHPTATAVKMAELLGIKARQCERILAAMKAKNLIRRVGANKNGHWEVC